MTLKSIKCKSCGASIKFDNSKKSGFCEFCGTAYVVEKKENSNFNLARRGLEFLEINEVDSADKCFNRILENDDYCVAYAGKTAVARNKNDIEKIKYYLNKVISAYDYVTSDEKEVINKLLNTSNQLLLNLLAGNALYDEVKFLLDNGSNVNYRSNVLVTPLITAAYWSKTKPDAPKVVRLLLEYGADESIICTNGRGVISSDTSQEVIDVIKELRPNADLSIKDAKPIIKTGGCYVATAVYGSYDCPAVWTLRRYRDNILKHTWYGCLFIKVYYAISPTFVKIFGQTLWFNKFFKARLDRLVRKLQDRGMECTPYKDIGESGMAKKSVQQYL